MKSHKNNLRKIGAVRSKEDIQHEINAVKGNETKLYSYLYDLVYKEWSNDVAFLEDTYNSFLDDGRNDIKRIAIYALLFALKIQRDKYKRIALTYARDINSGFDMRLTCVSSLAEAYCGEKDKDLLSFFYNLYSENTEDEDLWDLRAAAFGGMMKQLGMSTVEMTFQNGGLILQLKDINEEEFYKELAAIKNLIL